MQIQPILLCGGVGARLAPLSTPDHPKPFLPFRGGKSLFQATLERCASAQFLPPIIIGNDSHRYTMLNQLRDIGSNYAAIMLEPSAENTALAIMRAANYSLRNRNNAEFLLFLPSDHAIADTYRWAADVLALAQALPAHGIGLLGIRPTHAHAGYGYIAHAPSSCVIHPVQQFLEKPADAHTRWQAPTMLWNSGMVLARPHALRAACIAQAPMCWEAAEISVAGGRPDFEFFACAEAPASIPLPFDRAVLEKADARYVKPTACGWSDIGDGAAWDSAADTRFHAQLTQPRRIDRPWGYFLVTSHSASRIEKTLFVYPNARLSLQRHAGRTEDWHVIAGEATIHCADETRGLRAGDTQHIPAGAWHRLENTGNEVLVIHEVQSGMPDEADIERAADDYGRVHRYGRV
jgi:mannose-1-phosphate guanylyltransferase